MKRLKECRLEKHFTQKELSQVLNITQQTYSDYETGRTNPDLKTLCIIADVLAVSIDYLLGREDDFGNVTVYQQTDALSTLSVEEQKIIDALRRKTSKNASELLKLYAELPPYMQDSIFAELKGMHLGYTVSKNKNTVEG